MRYAHLPSLLRKMQETYLAAARQPETLAGRAFLGDGTKSGVDELELLFNSHAVLRAEFPAGGGTALPSSVGSRALGVYMRKRVAVPAPV